MLNVKKSAKRLISCIYECQKKIMINHHFIEELSLEGNGINTSGLQNEIMCLQGRIIEFRRELAEKCRYSY
jgi:hypothetical protein